jgi:hypothetical protein
MFSVLRLKLTLEFLIDINIDKLTGTQFFILQNNLLDNYEKTKSIPAMASASCNPTLDNQ